jgi:hypothetical protein
LLKKAGPVARSHKSPPTRAESYEGKRANAPGRRTNSITKTVVVVVWLLSV